MKKPMKEFLKKAKEDCEKEMTDVIKNFEERSGCIVTNIGPRKGTQDPASLSLRITAEICDEQVRAIGKTFDVK